MPDQDPGTDADGEALAPREEGSPTVSDPSQSSFLGADTSPSQAKAPSGVDRTGAPAPASAGGDYRVLARKYRPQTFSDLLGQEAMVRMLTNAFASGRVAHAFLLTGVRGVGKTTTARIIAKGLNCTGPGSDAGPTVAPCGGCDNCIAITQDRHVDVIEMDAASRTGVDDIREILDGVRFRPVSARYKIYIIDEIHMLSRHAFNALLKTLEEPPESVKFIFATTDVGKLPVTVLSRCQRFDLRRVDSATLIGHLSKVAAAEGATIGDEGLALLARAADGSVRDALSLLDQAIALQSDGADGVGVEQLRDMLGLADATQMYDLFEQLMRGDIAHALATFKFMHDSGADPLGVVQNLMELVHWLTRLKVAGDSVDMATATETEQTRGKDLSARLGMPILTRAWQMLLKGIGEIQTAPAAYPAAEMVLIRLAYAAELPPPGDLVNRLQQASETGAPAQSAPESAPQPVPSGGTTARLRQVAGGGSRESVSQPVAQTEVQTGAEAQTEPQSFADLVETFGLRREVDLKGHLFHNVHLVAFEPGRLEIRPTEQAPRDLTGRVVRCLRDWFGPHWHVTVSSAAGDLPLAEQARAAAVADYDTAVQDPLVKAVLDIFPGARIAKVTRRGGEMPDNGYADDDDGDGDGDSGNDEIDTAGDD
ncbi:MAG: DNA polymerase III subunit gamma/tau [Alphaproteobacteria bacterium]|nr:DNA polymerase III subunit gamma/tau [Alphaproteobacteria bacterium]